VPPTRATEARGGKINRGVLHKAYSRIFTLFGIFKNSQLAVMVTSPGT
jgi:hypothetical protein